MRPRAAISPDESGLTTLVSGCWGSAKCFVVAAIAASAVATATLKYLNEGGPRSAERRLEGDCIGEGCPRMVTWTTQPAGGALSVMHATWRVSRTRVKTVQLPALCSASMAGLSLGSDQQVALEVVDRQTYPEQDEWLLPFHSQEHNGSLPRTATRGTRRSQWCQLSVRSLLPKACERCSDVAHRSERSFRP